MSKLKNQSAPGGNSGPDFGIKSSRAESGQECRTLKECSTKEAAQRGVPGPGTGAGSQKETG